jgi:hypothetical protein
MILSKKGNERRRTRRKSIYGVMEVKKKTKKRVNYY